jgi:hypothetical protein
LRVLRGACLLLLTAAVATACTPLLSLDTEFTGAAETLCKCDAFTDPENPFWPDVEGSEGCIAYIQSRLGAEGATSWLASYREMGCDSCENAARCVSLPPVCIPTGEPCVGTSLASDASCCGYDANEVTKSYCGPSNVCSTNAPGCVKPLQECEEDIDCCGGDAGLAFCQPIEPEQPAVCFNVCELDDPVQCPGCCGRVQPKDEAEEQYGVCYNFEHPLKLKECGELCLDIGDCTNGLCTPEENTDFFIYVCAPLVPQ